MKILLVTATTGEIGPLVEFLEKSAQIVAKQQYEWNGHQLHWLNTGVGLTFTAFQLGKILALNRYDLAVNVGIAGSFDPLLEIGQVVEIGQEVFADLGAEDATGEFISLANLGLLAPDDFPFQNGFLKNKNAGNLGLEVVMGASVNKVNGYAPSIASTLSQFQPQIESMEGAAFFYACLLENVPFKAIRSISNRVEPRNRENWNIGLAVQNLNAYLIKWLSELMELKNL